MALPKAAQKQLDEATALHSQVYAEDTPELKEVSVEPVEPVESSVVPAKGETAPKEGGEATLQEVPRDPGEASKDVDWEHKYSVLQGKYNAEVPRLTEANNALQGRLGEMDTKIAQLMQQKLEPAPPPPVEGNSLLSADEIEDYGSDMIDVVKRAAREEFQPLLSKLREENDGLRQVLGGMQQHTAQDARTQMMATLDGEVVDWREINGNEAFLGWLQNVDPYSGQQKLELLRTAFEGNNTARVLAFFRGFLNENAAFTTRQEPTTAEPQVRLDTLVAPGLASDSIDTRAQEDNVIGRTWSEKEIGQFYREVQRGTYRDDPAEQSRLENDIFLAQSTGRIT